MFPTRYFSAKYFSGKYWLPGIEEILHLGDRLVGGQAKIREIAAKGLNRTLAGSGIHRGLGKFRNRNR